MPSFSGFERLEDTKDRKYRSNTKLQVSVHDSPGEKFIPDTRLKRLFQYHFGGDGYVVIPKGRVVAVSADNGGIFKNGTIKDMTSNTYVPVLTLANGGVDVQEMDNDNHQYTRAANKPIGVAAQNIYEYIVDGFNGMQPTIENEIYIELPYIPMKEEAEEVEWGCFYDTDPAKPIKQGDYVMSDENGRLVKADFDGVKKQLEDAKEAAANAADIAALKTATAQIADAEAKLALLHEQVVGQVWAVETNLPPDGWLKWVQWSQQDIAQDDNPSGFTANDIGGGDGSDGKFPGYPYVRTYANTEARSGKYYPQGIPGLTNGSNIEVPFTDKVIGQVQPKQSGRYDFQIKQAPIVAGSFSLKINGEEVASNNYQLNVKTGLLTLPDYDASSLEAPADVTATFKATGQIPGVPTNWDFKGSVGAIRVLLQK